MSLAAASSVKSAKSCSERFKPLLLAAASIGFVSYLSALNLDYELDDALIYRRYIFNLFQSGELVFNPGERFNALSSPLFSYLLILLRGLTGDLALAQMIGSAIGMGAAVLGTTLLFGPVLSMVGLGALLGLLCTSDLFYRTYGLESALFVGLLLLTIWARKSRKNLYPLFGVLLILTRGEGIFLIALLELPTLRTRRLEYSPLALVFPSILLALHLGFQWWYYGSPLPSTLTSKMAQGASGFWGDFPLFPKFGFLLGWYGLKLSQPEVIIFLLIALLGLTALRASTQLLTLLIFIFVLGFFYSVLNIPQYHWYYLPFLYCLYVLFVFGVERIAKQCVRVFGSTTQSAGVAFLTAFPFIFMQAAFSKSNLSSPTPKSGYRQIAEWLSSHTPSDAKIAALEVGALGLYSDRYVIDIIGITSPHNAEFLRERRMNAWLTVYEPDYLLAHTPPWPQEQSVRRLLKKGEFKRVEGFNFPGFQLIGRIKPADVSELE